MGTRTNVWQLALDTEAAQVGEALLRRYYEQVDSGVQEKLAPSTRAGRERAQDAELDVTRAKLKAACNLSSLTVDWSTVEEGLMNRSTISDACSKDVRTIVDFCQTYPNAVARVEAKSKVRCNYSEYSSSDGGRLDIERNELVYYVTPQHYFQRETPAILKAHFGEMDQVLEGEKGTLIFRYGSTENMTYMELDNRFYPIGNATGETISLDSGIRRGTLTKSGSDWSLECGRDSLPLSRVVGEKRKQVLAKATYEEQSKWNREPYFLARDTHGIYYYVDRYRKEFGGRHYRVFVGKRGMLKLTKLKGLVEDSEGTVFSTEKGELRLVVNPKTSAIWIRGNKRHELTAVEPGKNRKLIYDELGVYHGETLGHICDE